MRFSLKALVKTLFGRQSEHSSNKSEAASSNRGVVQQFTSNRQSLLTDFQILSVLDYWLDFELFDIPECPYDFKKGIVSEPADDFDKKWLDDEQPFPAIKKDSKLFVMFQCHRAGYLFKNEDGENGKPLHPNTVTPKSYLLGVALIPTLNTHESTGEKYLTWQLSEEDQDKVVNLATIRTIYRRCRSSVPANMTLTDWVDTCFESIDQLLNKHLSGKKDPETNAAEPLTTEQLKLAIIEINRCIAREFWPTHESREFMEKYAKAVEVNKQDKYDESINPSKIKPHLEDITTFRWRFCYYPDGNEQNQLGPFFADDLNHIAEQIGKTSAKNALSPALYQYLLGNDNQVMLGSAREDVDSYYKMTRGFFKGRWPENPDYGLSLLQSCAVNLATKKIDNPIVAVNGPPGTGKTTLLKDIIADRFVTRTIRLLETESSEKDWLASDRALEAVLDASIVVASSNNKAVENISMELPALGKIHESYRDDIGYFRHQSQSDEWGMFCAVLGNSSNRKAFCDNRLNKLLRYLKGLSNYLGLSPLVYQLKGKSQDEAQSLLNDYFGELKTTGNIAAFIQGIASSQKFLKTHMGFLAPLSEALEKVADDELLVEEFVEKWCQLDEKLWLESLNALQKLAQVWWKSELWKHELEAEYKDAKDAFNGLLDNHSDALEDLNSSRFDKWGIDPCSHLISKAAFELQGNEEEHDAEARIQQLSPIGSKGINQLRSELFVAALRVNEAMIKLNAAEHHDTFKLLPQLINGKYQSHENTPNHETLWGLLFLLYPVMSTSLSSVESQFRLMQKKATIGLAMFDEAGQSVNYHVVGLLQRCKQAMVVGDPIQLEPVVPVQGEIDRGIASDFIAISNKDGETSWGDCFLVSESSAQLLADRAGPIKALIGQRQVGLPLLVHRRCTDPMFSIANSIAYDNKMVIATVPYKWKSVSSGWFNVVESKDSIKRQRYNNHTEADSAFELMRYLVEHQPDMAKGGIYLITPFTHMKNELQTNWKSLYKQSSNKQWMQQAAQLGGKEGGEVSDFTKDNIGTVHTFQGKEASVVIFCLAASKARGTTGGIKWANSKPNLINVAVTRAKHHLFIVGNYEDWCHEACSSQLIRDGMTIYNSMDEIRANTPLLLEEHLMNTVNTPEACVDPSCSNFSSVW
ncbi:DEAD/DEAH box helicase [Photobacterium indicum]|uniref:DNA2/NAM7 helicase-like C-terminal domain-containing protein n=1 Tax=Photobacterium indicum TaxID=81447 RepID=A0A2T3L8K9_9GAMM|nr:AAA domain-containing protein [Photobacterium indicum]PSV47311.1 hypothetical protein C9J47_10550 [Photobacterium indicum]